MTRRLAAVVCALVSVFGSSAVAAAGTVHVSGNGWARVNASSANVWSIDVPSGTVQFSGPAAISMYCLSGAAPSTCVKRVPRAIAKWRIVAPAGFLAQGSGFVATISSTNVFDLNVQGRGKLTVRGRGTVTIRHSKTAYSGLSIFAIR